MLVSMSVAKPLEPLARVAVEFDKDDWSVGTVVKATPTGYKIDFDYGEKNKLIKNGTRIINIEQKRPLKKELTYKEVRELAEKYKLSRKKEKPEPVKKEEPVKPPKPPKVKPPKPPKVKPPKTETPKEKDPEPEPVKPPKSTKPVLIFPDDHPNSRPGGRPTTTHNPNPDSITLTPGYAPNPVPFNDPEPVSHTPPKPAPTPVHTDTAKEAEEARLVKLIGNPRRFKVASTSNSMTKIAHIREAWNSANKHFFAGAMREPEFKLSKAMANVRTLGLWRSNRIGTIRELHISSRLFNATEEQFLTVLVHEMCHQATAEIARHYSDEEGGHGHVWKSFMRDCGLSPDRYAKDDIMSYYTDEEKKKLADYHENINNAKESAAAKGIQKLDPSQLSPMQIVQAYDPNNDTWYKGILIGKKDRAGKMWRMITAPSKDCILGVPSSWFYTMTDADAEKYKSPEYHDFARNCYLAFKLR